MHTYNPATLSLQCDRELVKAGYDCQNMGDEELTSISDKLNEARLAAHTTTMAQIIVNVLDIYADEIERRYNYARKLRSISSILSIGRRTEMCYTFNKKTLLAQFDKELTRAFTESPKMSGAELSSISDKLYKARLSAPTTTMAQIIGNVRDIYGYEIERRHNYEITRLSISSILSNRDGYFA